jgi:hypothetical protein
MEEISEYKIMGHVSHMGEMRNPYKILVRKSEGKTWV